MIESKRGFITPKFRHHIAYNPAFKSLSAVYKEKNDYKTGNIIWNTRYYKNHNTILQKQQEQQQQQQQTKQKVYGAILVGKNPQTKEPLYALVQGRYTQKWSFPKGHSVESETPIECTLRELEEETGINRNLPDPVRYIKLVYGYYYLFDLSANLHPLNPRDKNEISDAKWVSLKEMEEMEVNADVNEFMKTYSDIT
jgi:8-oxo-dGTP pyrophosphatase MutT (NUDIX family)